jgi:prolyl oligopeptidase
MNSALSSDSSAAEPLREMIHGIQVEDPFRWLEDQEAPPTRSFIHSEQNTYRAYLDRHCELRTNIQRRVQELLTVETVDLPISNHRGGLLYLKRSAEEEQKAIYLRDRANSEQRLFSVEMLGRDSFTSLSIIQVSPDGRYLVFGIRTGGEDVQEIGIYNLVDFHLLADRLPRGFYRGLVFDAAQTGFFYSHEEAEGVYQLRRTIRRHKFGDDQRDDVEMFHAGDGLGLRLLVQRADDASALGYLGVSLDSVPCTRFLIHRVPFDKPPQEIVELGGPSFGPRFTASTIDAITTLGAPLGRIVRISLQEPDPREWSTLVPETDGRLYAWEKWREYIVVHLTIGCRKVTRIYSESGLLVRSIEYPESGTSIFGQIDAYAGRLFYSHSDTAAPPAIYTVNLVTGEHHTWWRQPIMAEYQTPVVEKRTYNSKDGVVIPLTLIRPSGRQRQRPVLLSAYGGGGTSITPKFSVLLIVLVEAGFTCAIAHVRGGGEGGLEWYLAARKTRKQASVDDLIHAAQWLIENSYTTQDHLGLAGQSSGGLLTLCALTQRPDLFRAALALGPITDLTRFHLFGVGRSFVAEIGSPDDPEEFAALYRLSPYHHLRQGTLYPALLIVSGDRDKRCDSLHARKMIARLREVIAPNYPVLLDYTETRGHKPVLPLSERIRALADRLTFLISELSSNIVEAEHP